MPAACRLSAPVTFLRVSWLLPQCGVPRCRPPCSPTFSPTKGICRDGGGGLGRAPVRIRHLCHQRGREFHPKDALPGSGRLGLHDCLRDRPCLHGRDGPRPPAWRPQFPATAGDHTRHLPGVAVRRGHGQYCRRGRRATVVGTVGLAVEAARRRGSRRRAWSPFAAHSGISAGPHSTRSDGCGAVSDCQCHRRRRPRATVQGN